jgi:hypothetical protein
LFVFGNGGREYRGRAAIDGYMQDYKHPPPATTGEGCLFSESRGDYSFIEGVLGVNSYN